MKKLIFFGAVLMLLLVGIVSAQEESISDQTRFLGAYGEADVSAGDFFTPLTIVDTTEGRFQCSDAPDYQYRLAHGGDPYVKQTDSNFCVTNNNHDAMIWILYNWNPWKEIATKKIAKGDKGCISGISAGTLLDYTYYYCDNEITTCTPSDWVNQGCDYNRCSEGEVLLTREVGGDTATCSSWDREICWKDSDFLDEKGSPYTCDAGSSTTVPAGSDGSDQEPTGTTDTKTDDPKIADVNLRGDWQNIAIPDNVVPGEEYVISARFSADTAGKYYLEAGMLDTRNPLAIVTASGSKCDNDVHWAGVFQQLNAGESVDVRFKPIAREEEGTYSAVLGAYTGCLDKDGEKVTVLSTPIKVTDKIIKEGTGDITTQGTVRGTGDPVGPSGVASVDFDLSNLSLKDYGIIGGSAIAGVVLGSIVPGIGNLVGGIVGAIIGAGIVFL